MCPCNSVGPPQPSTHLVLSACPSTSTAGSELNETTGLEVSTWGLPSSFSFDNCSTRAQQTSPPLLTCRLERLEAGGAPTRLEVSPIVAPLRQPLRPETRSCATETFLGAVPGPLSLVVAPPGDHCDVPSASVLRAAIELNVASDPSKRESMTGSTWASDHPLRGMWQRLTSDAKKPHRPLAQDGFRT